MFYKIYNSVIWLFLLVIQNDIKRFQKKIFCFISPVCKTLLCERNLKISLNKNLIRIVLTVEGQGIEKTTVDVQIEEFVDEEGTCVL